MDRIFLGIGATLGFTAVTLGAFASHVLKSRIDSEMLRVFEVGVQYHIYHSLAILLVAALAASNTSIKLTLAGWLFCFGIVVFSGSLYVLALTGVKWLGAITPLGGVAFLAGWLCLLWAALGTKG
jgi:uncharacterized membrane protein YgdD (TMEM256/DUF423 family)